MAATIFSRFSELPAELRDTIWELALPGPARRRPKLLRKGQQNPRFLHPSQIKDPVMLQVNRESRVIAMQFYERREHYDCRYGKYFNFELDDFYFAGMSRFPGWRRPRLEEEFNIQFADRRKIKNITLAFPWSYASSSPFNFVRIAGEAFLGCLLNFDSLKAITIEIWQDDSLDIMDVMAPRMHELDVSTNRMLRVRLTMIMDHILRAKASNEAVYEAPTWRIQVVAGNED
jgi:hypothetical protein